MADGEEKIPAKIHLFRNNRNRHFAKGASGVMANTLCSANFRHYRTSANAAEVTCANCLRMMARTKKKAPVARPHAALIAAATAASARAYAPYSRFHVGAALGFADGAIVTGANVENASYGLSLCAETVAAASAIAAGVRGGLVAVAVVGGAPGADSGAMPGAEPVTPCGRCRQVLHELAALGGTDPLVLSVGRAGVVEARLSALLPRAFGPGSL